MAKQEFEPIDYFGPVVVAIIFAITLFLISFFIINFFCISKYDDFTKFEKVSLGILGNFAKILFPIDIYLPHVT